MQVIYDPATAALTIDAGAAGPFGAEIEARINRHGQVIAFADLSFGVVVTCAEVETLRAQFPPPGVVYVQTDQDAIDAVSATWWPDCSVTIAAWIENAGRRVDATASFTAPRPPAPGPGWSWSGGQWRLNINTASAAELAEYLDGVGPSIAAAIVAARGAGGFLAIDGLAAIAGITPVDVSDWAQVPGLVV